MGSRIISGYVRDLPNQNALSGKAVTIRYVKNNQPVEVGGILNTSANPMTTSGSGYFEWQTDLNPGRVYVEAEIDTGSRRVRSGLERMQVGHGYSGDDQHYSALVTDGLVDAVVPTFSAVSAQVTVPPVEAIVNGRWFKTTTSHILAIDPNPTFANRRSLLALTEVTTGSDVGRQNIEIVYGTTNNVYPSIPAGKVGVVLAQFSTSINATASTINSGYKAPLSAPKNIATDTTASTAEIAQVAKADTSGVVGMSPLALGELSDVTTASAAKGRSLVFGDTVWQVSDPKTLISSIVDSSTPWNASHNQQILAFPPNLTIDKDKTYDLLVLAECEIEPTADVSGATLAWISTSAFVVDGLESGIPLTNVGQDAAVDYFCSRFQVTALNGAGTQTIVRQGHVKMTAYATYQAGASGTNPQVSFRFRGQPDPFSAAWAGVAKDIRVVLLAMPRG